MEVKQKNIERNCVFSCTNSSLCYGIEILLVLSFFLLQIRKKSKEKEKKKKNEATHDFLD